MHSGASQRTQKGAPAERGCSGTVSRPVGQRRHRPAADVSVRTPPRLRLYRHRLRRPDRRTRGVRVARRKATPAGIRLLGLARGGDAGTPTRACCGCSPHWSCCTRALWCTTTSSTIRPPAAVCRPCTASSPISTATTTGTDPRSSSGCRPPSCWAIWPWCGPTTSSPPSTCRPTRIDGCSGCGPTSAPRCSAGSTSTSSPNPAARSRWPRR